MRRHVMLLTGWPCVVVSAALPALCRPRTFKSTLPIHAVTLPGNTVSVSVRVYHVTPEISPVGPMRPGHRVPPIARNLCRLCVLAIVRLSTCCLAVLPDTSAQSGLGVVAGLCVRLWSRTCVARLV